MSRQSLHRADAARMLSLQRMAQSLGFFLQTGLFTAGLPCNTVLQSVTAVSGETVKDQVPSQEFISSRTLAEVFDHRNGLYAC